MNKSVITSLSPRECELIASGKQTMLVRKTRPKIETPFKCYIYCTALKDKKRYTDEFDVCAGKWIGNSRVIGEFVCDMIEEFHEWQLSPSGKLQEYEQRDLDRFLKESCISFEDVCEYRRNMPYYKPLYGWHISDLKIYDKPKELGELYTKCDKTGDEMCGDCLYLRVMLNSYPCDDSVDTWCGVDNKKPISRPPQSWVYCEPIEEE